MKKFVKAGIIGLLAMDMSVAAIAATETAYAEDVYEQDSISFYTGLDENEETIIDEKYISDDETVIAEEDADEETIEVSLEECGLSMSAWGADADVADYWDSFSTDYYYQLLSEGQQTLWDYLDATCYTYLTGSDDAIYKGTFGYTLPYCYTTNLNLSSSEVSQVLYLFLYSNPQYYFLKPSYLVSSDGGVSIALYEECGKGSKRAALTADLKEMFDEWILDIDATGTQSQLDLEMEIHDLICDTIVYQRSDYDQSLLSVMKYRKTVCAGYTKAMVAMLSYYDIPNAFTFCHNGNIAENHVWNLVYIENKWYVVDATWDDSETTGLISRSAFNTSNESFPLHYGDTTIHKTSSYPSWVKSLVPNVITTIPFEMRSRISAPTVTYTVNGDEVTVKVTPRRTLSYGGALYYESMTGTYAKKVVPTIEYSSAFTVSSSETDYILVNQSGVSGRQDSRIIKVDIPKTQSANKTQYIVQFHPNGGFVSTRSKTVTSGQTYGTLPTPTKEGTTFAGWFTKKSGGTRITASSVVNLKGNVTLYAHWTTKQYIITFDAAGGSVSLNKKTVIGGEPYGELPTPKRKGYTFAGWYTDKSGGTKITAASKVAITANTKLYAHWKAESYEIKFDTNGGTVSTFFKMVERGAKYGTLPTPTRSGYTFAGWYTAKTGGTKITESSTVLITKDTTLYALWTQKKYTVSFQGNGGTVTTTRKAVVEGGTYGTLPTPKRSGYIFDGWYTAKTGGTKILASSKVTITKNVTLYAHWIAPKYTVSFSGNGGTVSTSSKTVTLGERYGTLPTATKTGYLFAGWYTAQKGGYKIASTSKVSLTKNITLYARWNTPKNTTIIYDGNGGKANLSKKNVKYASKYGALTKPKRAGYTFLGWFTQASGGTAIKASDHVPAAASVTIYAHWEKVSVVRARITEAVSKASGKLQVTISKDTSVTGYQLQYSWNENMKNAKTTTVYPKNTTKVLSGLNRNRTYYVRVRAYQTDSAGKRIYGSWSTVKVVKTK